jgi:16S rRNA (cytosine967-C5)-methyltransferase
MPQGGGRDGGLGADLIDDRPLKAPKSFLRPGPPIDPARDAVCEHLTRQVERFPHLDLKPLADQGLDARSAAFAHAILDAVLRRWLTLRYLIGRRLTQPVEGLESGVQAALLVGAAQLLLLDRVPDYAAIDHSVEWTKRRIRPGAGGLVNAVLRRVAEACKSESDPDAVRPRYAFGQDEIPLADGSCRVLREPELPEDKTERLAVATSHAPQLIKTWLEAHPPAKVIELALHALGPAPTILNTAHAEYLPLSPDEAAPHAQPGMLVYTGPRETLASLLGSRADLWAQDPASRLAVESIRDLQPRTIFDLCAGRGTKTRQLAAVFPQAKIYATDIDEARRASLAQAFKGHPRVSVILPKNIALEHAGTADLVVLDVPCSNTGVLARRPEAKYRFNRQNMQSLVDIQRQLIADAIPLLAPNGQILYSTCSLDPRENQDIAAWAGQWHQFKRQRERTTLPAGGPGQPAAAYTDGAFSVLLTR